MELSGSCQEDLTKPVIHIWPVVQIKFVFQAFQGSLHLHEKQETYYMNHIYIHHKYKYIWSIFILVTRINIVRFFSTIYNFNFYLPRNKPVKVKKKPYIWHIFGIYLAIWDIVSVPKKKFLLYVFLSPEPNLKQNESNE